MNVIHVARLDAELGYEDEILAWYNGELAPALERTPGWVHLEQFECLLGEPHLLFLFHLEHEDVDIGAAIPFRDEGRGRRIRNYWARTFRCIAEAGAHPAERDFANVVFTEVFPGAEAAFNNWYSDVHMPEIVTCPGWIAGRRFACVDTPGLFLAIYDLEDAHTPFASSEYEAAVGWDDQLIHLRGYHGFRIYRQKASVTLGKQP